MSTVQDVYDWGVNETDENADPWRVKFKWPEYASGNADDWDWYRQDGGAII